MTIKLKCTWKVESTCPFVHRRMRPIKRDEYLSCKWQIYHWNNMLSQEEWRRHNHFIKLSLDDPSEAQIEEFTFEIEQMKLLGAHKNVVSMVGCCTLEEKMFLVIEYVPCGDLLTWLRRRRKKVRKSLQRVLVFWKGRPPFFMSV